MTTETLEKPLGRTIERCACGGYLWANYADPADMTRHVRHHQRTLGHIDWARRQDFGGYDARAVDGLT